MKNKYLYIIIVISSIVCLFLSFPFLKIEIENLKIDKYNFQQLEKVKAIFQNRSEDVLKFDSIEEFNLQYNAGIEPIKNCFYIKTENGKYPYIFGFKLKSIIYKIRYLKINYSYPKYDVEPRLLCMQGFGCEDLLMKNFIDIISNPCKE